MKHNSQKSCLALPEVEDLYSFKYFPFFISVLFRKGYFVIKTLLFFYYHLTFNLNLRYQTFFQRRDISQMFHVASTKS